MYILMNAFNQIFKFRLRYPVQQVCLVGDNSSLQRNVRDTRVSRVALQTPKNWPVLETNEA